ncbi:hypothetical protein V5G65_12685 [Mammaliicoccus sciuri]|uniref:hypothetical protein n=1 Tax=Mammaliicoccus sciuri TaxID=1296 RepID=UPI0037A9F1EE
MNDTIREIQLSVREIAKEIVDNSLSRSNTYGEAINRILNLKERAKYHARETEPIIDEALSILKSKINTIQIKEDNMNELQIKEIKKASNKLRLLAKEVARDILDSSNSYQEAIEKSSEILLTIDNDRFVEDVIDVVYEEMKLEAPSKRG